jgi:hypothetical protein
MPGPSANTEVENNRARLTVSGAKAPRFTREAVEQAALSALRDRIQAINKAKQAEYTISEAD